MCAFTAEGAGSISGQAVWSNERKKESQYLRAARQDYKDTLGNVIALTVFSG